MINLFFTALMFYTRLPVPATIDHAPDRLNRATVFFPLIGWIVGSIGAATFWGATFLFPPDLAVLLSMVATVWATGAFHEDGWADVCDAFGGGWTKTQILAIMKDSRLGTYGTIGLGLLLATKFFALKSTLTVETFGWAGALKYVAAHSLSRGCAVWLIARLPYARDEGDSKAKPVAEGISGVPLMVATLLALAPLVALIALTELWIYALFLLPLALVTWRLARYYVRWLGGYTGDCLGATQQLTEVIVYLSFTSLLWTSI